MAVPTSVLRATTNAMSRDESFKYVLCFLSVDIQGTNRHIAGRRLSVILLLWGGDFMSSRGLVCASPIKPEASALLPTAN